MTISLTVEERDSFI